MLRRNVENNHPAAVCHLGSCYDDGELSLVPSHKKAARLYQRAVELGDVMAMNNVGSAYEHGRGVKLDKKKAFKHFQMAADRGCATAQYNVGYCYADGDGVIQDYAEAFRFFKLAANQGFTEAEFNLGCMYEDGDVVARDSDTAEAIRWYERAAAKGHEKAKDALARLKK